MKDKLIGGFVLLASLAFLAGGILNTRDALKLSREGEKAIATVAERVFHPRRRRSPEHYTVKATVPRATGSAWCPIESDLPLGKQVEVLVVDEADGSILCSRPNFWSLWGLPLGLTFVGFPLFAVLGVLMMRGKA